MKRVSKEFNICGLSGLEEFAETSKAHGLDFSVSADTSILKEPIHLASGKTIPNSIGIPPLEGFDGTLEGAPTETVYRRYARYARGGAGLIWYESIAISDDGRCNPLQMVMNRQTMPEIKKVLDQANAAAMEEFGR